MGQAPSTETVARNAPCPCGSGKKYKLCCLPKEAKTATLPDTQSTQKKLKTALALHQRGELQSATDLYREVLSCDPHNPDALHLLGVAMEQAGRPDIAVEHIGRAIALQRTAPDYYYRNLALALRCYGDLAAAVSCLREALRKYPKDAQAHKLLGDVLHQLGDLPAAEACYRTALRLSPADGQALRDLGNVLGAQGDYAGALKQHQRAVQFVPEDADLLFNMGLALEKLGDLAGARASYEQSLRLRPNVGLVQVHLLHIYQHLCAWDGIEELWSAVRRIVLTQPQERISPFLFLSVPSTGAEQLACARNWAANRCAVFESAERTRVFAKCDRDPGTPLHIGYISSDFGEQLVAHVVVDLLERHDRNRFVVSAYSVGLDDGSVLRERIRGAVDHFVDLSAASNTAAAQRIVDDGVDILIDLTGYISLHRPEILALRPAPVQVNAIGYPGTSGAPFMDYILVDPFLVRAEHAQSYSERLAYIPDCYLPHDGTRALVQQTPTRAACGLPEQGFVFCSFNQPYKITPRCSPYGCGCWRRCPAACCG